MQYVDISNHNGPLDWPTYKQWAAQWDGISRVCIKLTEGTGFVDPADHFARALDAGIDMIIPYHYARPDLNPGYEGAQREVDFFRSVLKDRLRPQDFAMLDYEGYPGKPNAPWRADWCWDWCHIMAGNAGLSTDKVIIYSYASFITTMLQDPQLATFPLVYANYNHFAGLPPAPKPWSRFIAWQFSASATVPGVPGKVDCNQWIGLPPLPTPPPPGPDLAAIKAGLLTAAQQIISLANQL